MAIDTNYTKVNIVKFDRQSSFVTATVESFDIDKLKLTFLSYDKNKPKSSRTTASIDIYLDIAEAMALSQDLISKRIFIEWEKNKAMANGGFIDPPFISRSGVCEEKANRSDKKALSKQFKIEKYTDPKTGEVKYFFKALSGPGRSDTKGLIVPQYKDSEAEQAINIVMKDTHLIQFALMIRSAITGYHAKLALMSNDKFGKYISNEVAKALVENDEFINKLAEAITVSIYSRKKAV